jgi:hypothetical protein
VEASFRVEAGKSSVVVHTHPDGDGDFLVAIEASVDGFSGHADGHVTSSDFKVFADQCRALEKNRQGVASFSSALEGEFTLSLRSIDRLGHLGVAGRLHYRAQGEEFAQRLDFEFAFDPAELQNVLRGLDNI